MELSHTLQMVFNRILYRGGIARDLYDMTDEAAIEFAKSLLEENSMIDEIKVWKDGDIIIVVK